MRVLVVEGEPGAGADAVAALTAAGHETTSCHDEGSSFPCHGLAGGSGCPLEEDGPVDVALLVRDTPNTEPTPTEDGLRCALRRHVPLAIVGALDGNPYQRFAAATSTSVGDSVAATEQAANSPLAAHAGVARTALQAMLRSEGLDESNADAVVTRNGSALWVLLRPGLALDPMLVEVASVRVLAAVRAHDRAASIIDVSVADTDTAPAPAPA
ncbi:MAG: hypothetical protein ACLFRV_09040 [Acidimicrobiales bacterium]